MLFTSILLVLLVSSILLISHWSQNKGIVYLIATIVLFSLRQFTLLLINSDENVELLSILLIHFDALFFLIGPFLLYYLKSLVKGKFVVDKYLLVYAIPALIVGMNTLPYYTYSFENKVAHFDLVQETFDLLGPSNFPYLFFPFRYQGLGSTLFNLVFALYCIAYLVRLKKTSTSYLKKKLSVLLQRILIVIPILLFPNYLLLIYTFINLPKTGTLSLRQAAFDPEGYAFLVTLLLPLSFFLIPSWLYTDLEGVTVFEKIQAFLQRLWQRAAGHKVTAPAEKSADMERIISYIEIEKPYVNLDFSLHDLSRTLNIPRIRVSHCFNHQMNISFPVYRNKLRLAHAISLLQQGAHLNTSIEGIAERSGFKSKSIFYAAFKEEYHMTPTEWMRKNL